MGGQPRVAWQVTRRESCLCGNRVAKSKHHLHIKQLSQRAADCVSKIVFEPLKCCVEQERSQHTTSGVAHKSLDCLRNLDFLSFRSYSLYAPKCQPW